MEKELRKLLSGGKFSGVSAERSQAMRAVKGRGNKTTENRLRSGTAAKTLSPVGRSISREFWQS